MSFRIATLNLAQDHKRWEQRRTLIIQGLADLEPDVLALNEICLPLETGRWLQQTAAAKLGLRYDFLQQPRTASAPQPEAEGMLTRFHAIEQSHRYYSARDSVAIVARFIVDGRKIDVYVTHLYPSRREERLRVGQVIDLLSWIRERDDVTDRIVCGDFNATLEMESARLMAESFCPTQVEPTAFTPLQECSGDPTHKEWDRMDRCFDFIWVSESLRVKESALCFNRPSPDDPTLWPSDHVGVWADLELA